jgi:hypothetical protein
MAKNKEELQKKIKAQEKMRDNYASRNRDSLVAKLNASLMKLKSELKDLIDSSEKKSKPKTIAGSMTKLECQELIEKMKGKYLKSESTTKKNIKQGKAVSDGSLKPSASLENEAEIIGNKSDAGQTINKKEQKAIAFNIEAIVKNCIEMIKYKKDADQLIKDLITKLGHLRNDIQTGKLKPGSQN